MEKQFYQISIARLKNEVLLETQLNYNHLELMKAIIQPIEPLLMEVSEGKKYFDILGFQDTSNFAISERFYSLLVENNITGWKAYDLEINKSKNKYYGFQIIGNCGKLLEPKEEGFYLGYNFDLSSWNGDDIFSPEGTALIFSTKKVADLCNKNSINNLLLEDISKVENFSFGEE